MQATAPDQGPYASCGLQVPACASSDCAAPESQSDACADFVASMRDAFGDVEVCGLDGESDPVGDGRVGDARSAAPARSSLDLIEGHNSDKRILRKIEQYPSGARRIVLREVDVSGPIEVPPPRGKKRDRSEQERVDSSVQRSKRLVRQHCMAKRADRLLTLTYRENMEDRDRCYADFVRFLAKAQALGFLPVYVGVPERQKRGAWHVHIAMRGYMWVGTLRRLWREVVGQDNGNVDISYRKRGEGSLYPWRIAAYLSKYIGKAIAESAPGDRTFWASRWDGLQPTVTVELLDSGMKFTQVLSELLAQVVAEKESGAIQVYEWWMPKLPRGAPAGVQAPMVVWCA